MKTIMMTLCALLANTAFADIVTWVGPSIGDWGEPDNWEDSFNVNRVPDQFDRAVVDDAQVVINDTEHFIVDTINVMENATLRIDCDASLTLENDNDNLCAECEIPDPTDHSRIDGSVILFRGAILVVQSKGIYTTDHKFTGTGHIIGTSTPVNEIRIQPGKRMWNLLRNGTESGIRNHLTITRDGQTGTAGLLNDGDIVCSDPGTLSIDSSIDLEDTANGIYMVDDKDAVVALNTAALELEGDFVQTGNGGILEFNAPIATVGFYARYSPCACDVITINNQAYFQYLNFATGTGLGPGCANWYDDIVSDFFEINESKAEQQICNN